MDGYELIPMEKITDEARELAVLWMECDDKNWIGQKHKLASDIMNYAKKYHESEVKKLGLFSVMPCFSEKEIEALAFEWSSERSNGDAEQDSECMYDYTQGMRAMQSLLCNKA